MSRLHPILQRIGPGLFCALAAVIDYVPVWRFEYLKLDDMIYLLNDGQAERISQGFTPENFRWGLTTGYFANWHPMTWWSWFLDVELFGFSAGVFHTTNLLLHGMTTLVVALTLTELTGHRYRSAAVALLFAIHPLQVESVAWISERKELLSSLFGFLSVYCYTRFAKSQKRSWYSGTLATFACALLSKQMLVTLPCLLLLLDYWPLRRFEAGSAGGFESRNWRSGAQRLWSLVREKLPFFALSVGAAAAIVIAQRAGGGMRTLDEMPFSIRLLNTPIAYLLYLRKTFWPLDLMAYYVHPGPALTIAQAVFALTILAAISVAAVWARGRVPWFGVGWFWFLGTLVPVIGLVQVGAQQLADRYMYFPITGLLIAVVWSASTIVDRLPRLARTSTQIIAAAACVALGLVTWVQTQYWQDSVALFGRIVSVDPGSWYGHFNLGKALAEAGRSQEALEEFGIALELRPGTPDVLACRGVLLLHVKRAAEAVACFEASLRHAPDDAKAHYNLATGLVMLGYPDQAIEHFQLSLQHDSQSALTHHNLAITLHERGEFAKAAEHYRSAIKLDPNLVEAYLYYSMLLRRAGRSREADAFYLKARKLNADLVVQLQTPIQAGP